MAKKINVLYVDDEQQNLLAFRAVFRRFFNVFIASGGPEAIELLDHQPIDLVLSDQRMPAMTGIELCEYVMKKHPSAARIIVTGYSEMEPIHLAIKEGKIRDYVMKPWKTKELRSMIENAIGGEA